MKRLPILLILCIVFFGAYSQEKTTKVSHYLFPEFKKGVVLMKHGGGYSALLNYNSLTEELVFENNGNRFAIAKDSLNNIDSVFISDKKLVLLNNKFVEVLNESYFNLYVEHKCKVNSPGSPAAFGGTSYTSATSSVTSIYSQGGTYELELPDEYRVEPYCVYFLNKNGELKKFTSIKQIVKFYKSKKDIVKGYIKENNIKFENPQDIVELICFIESKQ